MLLRSAIAEGVDYVDLEDDIADNIPRYGKTKRIISLHDFRKHARRSGGIAQPACRPSMPDIVKIATMANQPHDNLRMLAAGRVEKCRRSASAWATSARRRASWPADSGRRLRLRRFITNARCAGAAQLSADDRDLPLRTHRPETAVYRRDRRSDRPQLEPDGSQCRVRQSRHERSVRAVSRASRAFGPVSRRRAALGIHGLSVTIPHKEAVLK